MKLRRLTTIEALRYRIAELEAQVAGLEQMNTEKAAEIRRLRMGNQPAGPRRPFSSDDLLASVTDISEQWADLAEQEETP